MHSPWIPAFAGMTSLKARRLSDLIPKMLAAIALIQLMYLLRRIITAYLGSERAAQLRREAAA